jgi:pyruvate dehydrogenase (quinone)
MPSRADLDQLAALLNAEDSITILCGSGCQGAHDELLALGERLKTPMVHALRGKEHVEWDNPYDVGMTGLIGFSSGYYAMRDCDVLLMLGTDFPFSDFLPHKKVKTIQVDRDPGHIGRRAPLELGVVGDVAATLRALAPMVQDKHGDHFLREHVRQTEHARRRLGHYVTKGPGLKPIRPEYVAAVLSELADDDAIFTVDTGTPCIWSARHIEYGRDRRLFGSFTWASMANAAPNAFGAALAFPGRQAIALCGDGGFTMLGLGDLLTQVQRKARVVNVIFNNGMLDFVNLEQQEAGFVPFGTDFVNPDFSQVATALGARGIRVEEPGDVRDAVAAALAHTGGPVVVDMVVDRYALALPSHVPAATAKGFTLSIAKQVLSGKMDEVIETVEHNVRLL